MGPRLGQQLRRLAEPDVPLVLTPETLRRIHRHLFPMGRREPERAKALADELEHISDPQELRSTIEQYRAPIR